LAKLNIDTDVSLCPSFPLSLSPLSLFFLPISLSPLSVPVLLHLFKSLLTQHFGCAGSESDDMVFEEFKRVYLKGVIPDDDESPTEA
jgi:hypothetical protein